MSDLQPGNRESVLEQPRTDVAVVDPVAAGSVTALEAAAAPEATCAGRPVNPIVPVGFILGAVAVATGVLVAHLPDVTHAARPSGWWMIATVAAVFALAELFAFHIEYRREAFSFSVSEVPTAMALAFLSPGTAIAIRVAASLVVIAVRWRQPPLKLMFNGVLFAFETALAFVIVRQLFDASASSDPWLLVAVGPAVLLATITGSVVVSLGIACFEGDPMARLHDEIRTTAVVGPTVALVATTALAPALVQPWFAFVGVLPVTAGWYELRRHGGLAQRYRDLHAIHGFSGVVGHSIDLSTVAATAVEEACRLLRAANGVLFVYGDDGGVALSSRFGATVDVDPTRMRDEYLADGTALAFTTGTTGVAGGKGIAVPIIDDGGMIGLLALTDRVGAEVGFDNSEVERANTLATQLSASLRRALLHSRMEYRALHDDLTGGWNRIAFEQEIERHRVVPGQCSAVIMLDLDRFKEVNDTLGHHAGDQVLIDFADRIRGQLRPDDVFARFGGDEFAILVRRSDLDEVHELAERILTHSFTPLRLGELDVVVTTSTGIAVIEHDDSDTAELLRRADIAMYSAKREHTRIEIYQPEIDRRTPERLSLLGGLRAALEAEELQAFFQPKIDLVANEVVGAEALVRWYHPDRGWVPPVDFIGIAEESGLIKQVTDQVLVMAIRAVSNWAAVGHQLGVAVNLSTHDLLDELLPQRIGRLLDHHEVRSELLTLEITESALLTDTPRISATIDRLHRLGVRLSLDDFGTGYSSLGYLRRLPVAELKVDRSFVKNLLVDDKDAAIVQSTIDLAHNLGLHVVAEGIEEDVVRERLHAMGCDIGQGYGICRPIPPDEFAVWLESCEYHVPPMVARPIPARPGGLGIDR